MKRLLLSLVVIMSLMVGSSFAMKEMQCQKCTSFFKEELMWKMDCCGKKICFSCFTINLQGGNRMCAFCDFEAPETSHRGEEDDEEEGEVIDGEFEGENEHQNQETRRSNQSKKKKNLVAFFLDKICKRKN